MNHKLFSILILSFLLLADIHLAQSMDTVSISITEVKVGSSVVDQSEWKNLSFTQNVPLTVDFEPSSEIRGQIFYKVFLDGNLFSVNQKENRISLNNLKIGTHVLKITPAAPLGGEGIPLLISFSVTGDTANQPKAAEDKSGLEPMHYLDYILAALIVVQLFIIIYLISVAKRKRILSEKVNASKDTETQDRTEPELTGLKKTIARCKDELIAKQETVEYLQKQLKEVNENIQDLERANVHLVEQKDKLEQSKYKLEALHAQKEEMFAMVIHDIKNPASAIRGYIDLLNSFDLNANEQQEIMVSLVATSEDIVKMSQDMCTILAKPMPEPSLNFTRNDVNRIIETVVNQNVSYSKTKKVKLVKKNTTQLPELYIDSEKIEEALDNLLNNAIKFAPPDTTIEISSYLKGEKKKTVVVAVKDTGVGLSEEDLRRSFQKGSTLSARPTGLEQSSGLGLWIVKKIIEEHGGKVWVESKLGAGSTFGFELPVE
ncbi:MAG: HAMP domain-containing sensor histidine kinase [Ignavibacteria bacterium]|nr:HAMP domain-containing sensor histidine kinase [Ignavibacteria bacterium]